MPASDDAALSTTRQALDHPGGRGGAGVHAAHDAAGETATQVRRLHLHRQPVLQRHGRRCKRGFDQGRAGERGHLARDAVHAQAMRQVGRELEGEQHVVEQQLFADVATHRRVCWQLQQTTVVFAQLEFARRAQHALTFHATQLAQLDQERFAIITWRQLGAHQSARDLDAHARIGRTAHDVEQAALPHIHLAHAQAVGVGVLLAGFDFAHNDLGERRRHRLQFFNFQTSHGQGVGQLLAAQGRVAEGAKPGFGELHVGVSAR